MSQDTKVITETEQRFLEELHKWSILDTAQIHRLIAPETTQTNTRAILRRLVDQQLVKRFHQPYRSAQWWLTPRGANAIGH